MYRKFGKRIIDFVLSLFALILFLPLIIITSIIIKIKLGSPVIFCQPRIGKDNKIFNMYKFRTMSDQRDDNGKLLPDNQRLTRLGRILRATSLDELPELINILRGDLSIIGPRPLLVEYLPYYTEFENQRHLVSGGLIPPEVLYQNIMPSWEQQFNYEVNYVNNLSFLLDARIILTVFAGLFKRYKNDYGNYNRKSLLEERNSLKIQ